MDNLYEKTDQFRLLISGTPYIIEEPVGWDGIKIIIKRDKDYHGLDFEFTDGDVNLTFTEVSGLSIIASQYKNYGNDADVILQFGFLSNDVFTTEFEGYVDFNTYKKVDIGIECSVKRKNFNDTLETRFETPVTLKSITTIDGDSMPAIDPVNIVLHSKALSVKFVNKTDMLNMGGAMFTGRPHDIYFFPDFSQPEFDDIAERNNPGVGAYTTNPTSVGNYNWDIKSTGAFNISIDVQFKVGIKLIKKSGLFTKSPEVKGWSLKFMLYINSTAYEIGRTSGNSGKTFASGTVSGKLEKTVEIKQNDKIYIFGVFNYDGKHDWNAVEIQEMNMQRLYVTLQGETKTESSGADFFLIHETADRVLKSISNNQAYLKSDLLGRTDLGYPENGEASLFAISNGYQIRNFETTKRNVIISMKEILTSLNALYGIGMNIEQEGSDKYVRIERFDYYYRDVEIISLDNVSDYQEQIDTDIIYNEIEIGYKKYPTDEISVMDEFNTKHSYITPIVSYKKKLSLLSELIGSGYAIELTRRQQLNNSPTDSWKYDEDNFIVAVVDGVSESYQASFSSYGRIQIVGKSFKAKLGDKVQITGSLYNNKTFTVTSISQPLFSSYTYVYVSESVISENFRTIGIKILGSFRPERDENFNYISNILGRETSYNLRISPKRMLLNHSQWINSGLAYKQGYDLIKNTFFSLNGDLRTRMTGEEDIIEEKANEALLELDGFEKIFRPEKITFKAPLTYDQIKYIKECHQNQNQDGKNYGYIRVKDDEGNWKAGYLMSLEYNPVNEMCSFVLRKKYAPLNDGFECSDYSTWNFSQFEAATGLPAEIEQCKFSDFI